MNSENRGNRFGCDILRHNPVASFVACEALQSPTMFKQRSTQGAGMNISQRKLAIGIRGCSVIFWLFLMSSYAEAQVNGSPAACSSPEVVLKRYVDAIGGAAAIQEIETQVAEAKAEW